MIKNEDPSLVYFPSPATAKENIHGHMIEQNKPPLMKAYVAVRPVVSIPIIIAIAARTDRVNNVLTGFSWPKKIPAINISMQII
jgi:hypothetical protein